MKHRILLPLDFGVPVLVQGPVLALEHPRAIFKPLVGTSPRNGRREYQAMMTRTNRGLPESVTITTIPKDGLKETLLGQRADGTALVDLTMTGTKKQ
jgi:hypothetical protein